VISTVVGGVLDYAATEITTVHRGMGQDDAITFSCGEIDHVGVSLVDDDCW
jgi:hypothetical protein